MAFLDPKIACFLKNFAIFAEDKMRPGIPK